MMNEKENAFTLIESVIALGVLGVTVAIILGVFSKNIARTRAVEERLIAHSVIGQTQVALVQIGWEILVERGGLANGEIKLVANVEGSFVARSTDSSIPAAEQYFLITPEFYNESGHVYGNDLLGVAMIRVLVSWPYRAPDSDGVTFREIAPEERRTLEFITSIRQ